MEGDETRRNVNIAQKYYNATTGQWVEANGVAIGILDGKVRIEIGSRQVEPFQRFAHIAPNV